MSPFSLTSYSMRYVLGNLDAAVRLGWSLYVLYVIQAYLLVWSVAETGRQIAAGNAASSGGSALVPVTLALAVAGAVIGLVIAVNWQRFVLLNERPWARGIWPGRREWLYFLFSLKVALVVVVAMVPVVLLIGALAGSPAIARSRWILTVLQWLLVALVMYASVRVSLVFPATAIDAERRGMLASWRATRPYSKDLFILVLVIVFLGLVEHWLATLLAAVLPFGIYARSVAAVAITAPIGLYSGAVLLAALAFVYADAEKGRVPAAS